MSAATTLWIYLTKLFAPSLILIIINKFKKNKKMRKIEFLQEPCRTTFLELNVRFAKAEIEDLNLPAGTDVIEVALDYCHQLDVLCQDFDVIDCESVPRWVGPRPIKVPR